MKSAFLLVINFIVENIQSYLSNLGGVHDDLWGLEGGGGDKLQVGVTNQLSGQPQEGLLKVVVALGRDVVVLQVLLAVEHDGLCLHLPVLDVDLDK